MEARNRVWLKRAPLILLLASPVIFVVMALALIGGNSTPSRPAVLAKFVNHRMESDFGDFVSYRVPNAQADKLADDITGHYRIQKSNANHTHYPVGNRINCFLGFRARGRTAVTMVTSAKNCTIQPSAAELTERDRHVSVLISEKTMIGRVFDIFDPTPTSYQPRRKK